MGNARRKNNTANRADLFFWPRVSKTDTCWLWTGGQQGMGYGCVRFEGRASTAHRVSFELANGPIPNGLEVMHTCDTPLCVRPDHLKLGTHKENMHDMIQKGRSGAMQGELRGQDAPVAVLRNSDVAWARHLRSRGFTYKRIVELLGRSSISNLRAVCSGQTWQHI